MVQQVISIIKFNKNSGINHGSRNDPKKFKKTIL